MKKTVYVNDEVARLLKPSLGRQADFQSFSGSDISAYVYLPLATRNSALLNTKNPRSKLLAEIQTISISSTRSISPVRVLGRESPVAYTRGARCIPSSEKVLVKNKGYISIADINQGDEVQVDHTTYRPVLSKTNDGKKQCIRIRLAEGYSIATSYDHPIMTPQGWKLMKDISINDSVYTVTKAPCGIGLDIKDDILVLIAYLLGDGSTHIYKEHIIQLSIADSEMDTIGKETEEILNRLDIPFKDHRKNNDKCVSRRISVCKSGKNKTWYQNREYNELHDALIKYKLYNKKSYQKEIPNEFIAHLSYEQICLFLSRLWSTDGSYCISQNARYIEAQYVSTSPNLINSIRLLLCKIGISAIVYTENKLGKLGGRPNIVSRHGTHKLTISKCDQLLLFINKVNIFSKSKKIEPYLETIRSRLNRVFFKDRSYLISIVEKYCIKYSIKKSTIFDKYGLFDKNLKLTPRRLLKICKDIPDTEFSKEVNQLIDELILDNKGHEYKKVISIEDLGILDIYDIEVEDRHEFICNFIKVHNTFAGTLVFASVNQDVFKEIYDQDIASSMMAASTSLTSDQLPPFSIIITAANEKGAAAIQAIHGVTLVNYGTTYSVDDLYTEVTYSYVATDVVPLSSSNVSMARTEIEGYTLEGYKNIGQLIQETMSKQYGSVEDKVRAIRKKFKRPGAGPDTYLGKYGTF